MLGGKILSRWQAAFRSPPCPLSRLRYLATKARQGKAERGSPGAAAAAAIASGGPRSGGNASYTSPDKQQRGTGSPRSRRRTREQQRGDAASLANEAVTSGAHVKAATDLQLYTRWRESRKAGEPLPLDLADCVKVFYHLCSRQRELEEALELLRQMEEEGPAPDGRCYGRLMSLCADVRKYDVLKELQQLMGAKGVRPIVHSENAVLKMYRDQGRLEEMLERIDSWSCEGPRNILTYTLGIDACAKLGRWEKALELLEAARAGDLKGLRLYNSAAHACARAGRVDEVVALIKEIKALGLQPDVCTYGTAIDACAKLAANALNEVHQQHYITGSPVMTRTPDGDRAVESAVALFGEMKAQGLKPNEFVYGALLDTCRRAHRLDLALQYVRSMQTEDFKVNDVILINLMDSYGRAGDWRMTLDLLEAFTKDLASRKGSSDPPPASSLKRPAAARSAAVRVTPEEEQLLKRAYTVAITACGRVGQWQMAVELMSKMLAQGVEPDVVSYGATIWACTKAKRWGAAQRLFYRMEQDKVAPTLIVCNAVITSFASSDAQWREPLRIFNEMESRFKLKPELSTYAAILSVLSHFSRHQEAMDVLQQMRASGVKPTQRIYGEVLQALAKSKQARQAVRVLEEMKSLDGLEPSGLCLARAMAACSRGGDAGAAQRIYRWMEDSQYLPRHADTRKMLSEYVAEGRWEEAASVVEALILLAYHPDPTTYNGMMMAFGRAKCWSSAVKLLFTMEERGVPCSEVNYETLIYAAGSNGQWPVAFYLAEDLATLGRARVNTAQALVQAIDDEVLSRFGPHLYRRLHDAGMISHRHREDPRWVVDFHGLSSRLAVCAMLSLLEGLVHDTSLRADNMHDLTVVVGLGTRSEKGVPVLGPTLIKALSSSPLFDPPLHTFDVPFNSGRIVIPRTELAHYILEHRARLGVLQQPHTYGEAAESSAVPAAVV